MEKEKDDYTRELTVSEVSQILDISKSTVRRRLRKNKLEGNKKKSKYGLQWFIPVSNNKNKKIYYKLIHQKSENNLMDAYEKFGLMQKQLAQAASRAIQFSDLQKQLEQTASRATQFSDLQKQLEQTASRAIQFSDLQKQLEQTASRAIQFSDLQKQLIESMSRNSQINNIQEQLDSTISNLSQININIDFGFIENSLSTGGVLSNKKLIQYNLSMNNEINKIIQQVAKVNFQINQLDISNINQNTYKDALYFNKLDYLLDSLSVEVNNSNQSIIINYKDYLDFQYVSKLIDKIKELKNEIIKMIIENSNINYTLLYQLILYLIILILFLNSNNIDISAINEIKSLFPKILEILSKYINFDKIMSTMKYIESNYMINIPQASLSLILFNIMNKITNNKQ